MDEVPPHYETEAEGALISVALVTRIVIIGGGIIGCSIAYHLAKRGERDVVLLERLQLTHGATWHAAGLVGQLRSSSNLTRLMRYSAPSCTAKLEAETGQATGWHRLGQPAPRVVGGALAGAASARRRWPRASASTSISCPPREARELFPLLETAGVVGAAWIEGDGYVDPDQPHQCLRGRRARRRRASSSRTCRVTALERRGRRVTTVVTEPGRDRRRMRDQRGRHVGPRDRRDGRHARAGVRGRAPVLRHREVRHAFPTACPRCAIPTTTST